MRLGALQPLLLHRPVAIVHRYGLKGFWLVEPKGRAQYGVSFILFVDPALLGEGVGAARLGLTWPWSPVNL